jgi:beta-lactamase superfamily II metal-dependent hydrolase
MPFLEKRIDAVILSHIQSDHVGGFVEITKRYAVQNVYLPTAKLPEEMYEAVMNSGIHMYAVNQDDEVLIGENEWIKILWPPIYQTALKIMMNMFSCCIYVLC